MRGARDTTPRRRDGDAPKAATARGFRRAVVGAAWGIAASTSLAHAHEFWLEPTLLRAGPATAAVAVDIRNGERFVGERLPLIPERISRLELHGGGAVRPIGGRLGDIPAITVVVGSPGVYSMGYVSTPAMLRHDGLADFARFAAEEGAAWAVAAHRRRALPEREIVETYTRYAKTVFVVGDAHASSRRCAVVPADLGHELELTPLRGLHCPDSDDARGRAGGTLALVLRYRGRPLPDAQVALYRRADGDTGPARRRVLRTDAHGVVRVAATGPGEYLVNAVLLREPAAPLAERSGAVWESLWASITFALPPPRPPAPG